MKQMKKDTTSIEESIDPSRSSHLDALLERFFQSNKFDKKRLDFSSQSTNKKTTQTPLNNNSTQYSTLVPQKQSNSTEQQQQQSSKNNCYPFSSSDSDDNAIEQFRPKGTLDDSANSNKQQQLTSQKTFVKLYQSEKMQTQKDLSKIQSSSLEKSDCNSLDTKSSMSPNEKQEQEQGKTIRETKSNQPDDIEQDLHTLSGTLSEKRSLTQSQEQLSPSKKQLQQSGPKLQNNEQNSSKQANSIEKLSEEQQTQQEATCGQGKNQIQNLLPLSASSYSNNQLPARQQFSMKDIINQHRQVENNNQKAPNHTKQQYSQEDIEFDEESENIPLRNNLSSNIKQLFKSKSVNNAPQTLMQKQKSQEEQESIMGSSSFKLRKLSPKTNQFEIKSRKIFQDSDSDDDDEDRDEVEALKEIARNFKQQENTKLDKKENSFMSNSAPVPCMNGIKSILSQFEDKEKALKQEKLNFEKANKDKNGKTNIGLKKSDRISGKVSDIKKLTLSKASSQNVKRSRYEYEEEEEEDKSLKQNVFYNEESQDISSDYLQNEFEFGQRGGKMKNQLKKNTKDQEMQKKLGLSQDPKKKRCLEKHKIKEDEEEEKKVYKSSQINLNLFKTDSKSQKTLASQNSMSKQDSKGKRKNIVDSDDEESEIEKIIQNNRKQMRRKQKQNNDDIESSCNEHSQKNNHEGYYDEEDSFIDDNPQYDDNDLIERELFDNNNSNKNPLFKSQRLQLNSQKSLPLLQTQSQKQQNSYPSLQQLLSQKEKFSEFLENPYQQTASSPPSSQKIDQQNSIEKGEKKVRKKLVKAAHIEDIANFQCTICLDQPTDSFFGEIDCQHRFCYKCIFDWSKVTNQCPMCRMEFSKILKRNFNGTVCKNQPYTFVRRKKQKINENDYIEEAQALQDEEDRQADQLQGNSEPTICYKCCKSDNENLLLICDVCDENYCHTFCDETLRSRRVPEGRWACHFCRF